MAKNIDDHVVADFGREWAKFDQSGVSLEEVRKNFKQFFSLFFLEKLSKNSEGFGMVCKNYAERLY